MSEKHPTTRPTTPEALTLDRISLTWEGSRGPLEMSGADLAPILAALGEQYGQDNWGYLFQSPIMTGTLRGVAQILSVAIAAGKENPLGLEALELLGDVVEDIAARIEAGDCDPGELPARIHVGVKDQPSAQAA